MGEKSSVQQQSRKLNDPKVFSLRFGFMTVQSSKARMHTTLYFRGYYEED